MAQYSPPQVYWYLRKRHRRLTDTGVSFDFTAGNLDSRITFSRPSLATMFDSTGKLTYCPNNLLLWSNDLSNAAWVKGQNFAALAPLVTANYAPAPDGSMTANRVILRLNGGTDVNDFSYLTQYVTSSPLGGLISCWVRSTDGVSSLKVKIRCGSNNAFQATVTGSWQRIYVKNTSNNEFTFIVRGNDPGVSDTSDILVAWCQNEAITYETAPRAYNPTTTSAYYGPRFDCDPVTLGSLGLLIEPAATNLIPYSDQFDQWGKSACSVTANTASSPDGLVLADKLFEDNTNAVHYLGRNITISAGLQYALSGFGKAAERTRHQLILDNGSTDGAFANFDLQAGSNVNVAARGAGTLAAAFTKVISNGWVRIGLSCLINGSATTSRNLFMLTQATTGYAPAYAGDGTSGSLLFGSQLELGSKPTSYIPTSAAAATRAADSASFTIPPGVSTLRYTFDDASTQDIAVSPGAYSVPTNLNRPWIKSIKGLP